MSIDLVIPLLIYCGMAFGAACVAVLAQAVLLDFTSRSGRWVIPMLPFAIVLGVLMTAAFSGRNLKLMTNESTGAEVDVAWVSRSISAALLALAIAKVFAKLREFRREDPDVNVDRQHLALYVAFVAFFLGMYVSPMAFSAHPTLSYKGAFSFAVFTAVYVCRKEPLAPVITTTKTALLIMMVGSLAAAVLRPALAIESNYSGLIPGLHSRLWGLAAHANGLGAMALLLIVLQLLQPSGRKLLNASVWILTLAVFFLAQSKTTWLAGVLICLVLLSYRHGRDANGRVQMGLVVALVIGLSLLTVGALFVNVDKVFLRFEMSDTGAGISNLTGRTEIWAAAWKMWLDSPMFGYGLDAWGLLHRLQLGLPFAVHAHNQLMQALSVGGLAAAIPLLVYFSLLAYASVRAAKRTRGVSLALFVFIAMRCVSETPMDVSGILSGDVLCQLLLFMLVVNERNSEVTQQPGAADFEKRGGLNLWSRVEAQLDAGRPYAFASDAGGRRF